MWVSAVFRGWTRLWVATCALSPVVGCERASPVQPLLPRAAVVGERSPDEFVPGLSGPMGSGGLKRPGIEREFYPLEIGNRWLYGRSEVLQIIDLGAPPPPPPQVRYTSIETVVAGTESILGREYIVERSARFDERVGRAAISWLRLRQDDDGLYVANVNPRQAPAPPPGSGAVGEGGMPIHAPAMQMRGEADAGALARTSMPTIKEARALLMWAHQEIEWWLHGLPAPTARSGGPSTAPMAGESIRLRYPLRPGATWVLGNTVATVERYEDVRVLMGFVPAFRIRLDVTLPVLQDSVVVWYGRCGRLRTFAHVELLAMDPLTGQIVRLVSTVDESLAGHAFVGAHRCPVRPPWARTSPTDTSLDRWSRPRDPWSGNFLLESNSPRRISASPPQ